jgi:DnaJ-class molecular chaperone
MLELTAEEEKHVLDMRKAAEERAKLVKCPTCDGKGETFSGYYGHPETSDGGPVMYRCSDCNCLGLVSQKKYLKLKYK